MFRLVRVVLPCGRLSSLDRLELSQHLWTTAAKNGERQLKKSEQDGSAADCRDKGAATFPGEGFLIEAAGSTTREFRINDTGRVSARTFSSTGCNYIGERSFSHTAFASVRSRGNEDVSTSGARQAGTRNGVENGGMEDSSGGSSGEPVKKSKFGVQATEEGPAHIVRSIVKEHGPLNNHEVWTFAQDAGIKSKSHMKTLLRWLQERNQLQLVCVIPPDKQTPIKPEGEFFYRIPKKGQLKTETKDEVLRRVVERRKAVSP